jgi:hypothetical protein
MAGSKSKIGVTVMVPIGLPLKTAHLSKIDRGSTSTDRHEGKSSSTLTGISLDTKIKNTEYKDMKEIELRETEQNELKRAIETITGAASDLLFTGVIMDALTKKIEKAVQTLREGGDTVPASTIIKILTD